MSDALPGTMGSPPPFRFELPPPLYTPSFIVRAQEVARKQGVAVAAHHLLEDAGVTIAVAGDESWWNEEGEGALWYGNHRSGLEPLGLLAVFGSHGRNDVSMFGKPYALQARFVRDVDENLVLPVCPSRMASDSTKRLHLRDQYWRWRFRGNLPTSEQLAVLNTDSQQRAVAAVAAGELAIIFPTGRVAEALDPDTMWYNGIGQMALGLANAGSNSPLIAFQFAPVSRRRLLMATARYAFDRPPKPYTITLQVAEPLRPQDIVGEATDQLVAEGALLGGSAGDRLVAGRITALLRERFVREFGPAPV